MSTSRHLCGQRISWSTEGAFPSRVSNVGLNTTELWEANSDGSNSHALLNDWQQATSAILRKHLSPCAPPRFQNLLFRGFLLLRSSVERPLLVTLVVLSLALLINLVVVRYDRLKVDTAKIIW
jgi:hypothetical protein